jgi:hypothetical protein
MGRPQHPHPTPPSGIYNYYVSLTKRLKLGGHSCVLLSALNNAYVY